MILQDLIRNYILYREVLRPMLNSWKQSLTSGYQRGLVVSFSSELNLALNKAKSLGDGEELGWDISDEYEAMSLIHISGTRTITTTEMISTIEEGLLSKYKRKNVLALSSNSTCIVLMGNQVDDCIAGIGKTSTQSLILSTEKSNLNLAKTYSLTTGYESKQINSYLISETHEKREYLGEFSLTHEETQLFSFKEGGDYHDTDKESLTAIV